MNKNGDRKHPVEFARHLLRNPHDNSCDEKDERAVQHHPPELFLSGVEAPLRWHQLIAILSISADVLAPALVLGNLLHVSLPHAMHPENGSQIDQSDPRMPIADGCRAAEHVGKPVSQRRKDGQARKHEVGVSNGVDPVISALSKGIALYLIFWYCRGWTRNNSAAHRFTSSTLSTSLGPKRM